jgi:hypothetical protein
MLQSIIHNIVKQLTLLYRIRSFITVFTTGQIKSLQCSIYCYEQKVKIHFRILCQSSFALYTVAENELSWDKKFCEELTRLLSLRKSLFEVIEPNLMELNLNELTLTSLNSILRNITEVTAVKNLVAMEHNPNLQFSKAHLKLRTSIILKRLKLWD